jgi:ubiquilin
MSMNVRVLTIDGTNFTTTLSSYAGVTDLKNEVSKRLGKPAESFMPVFLGRTLIDGSTLQSLGVRDGATVHIVNRFVGGGH